MDPVTVGYNCRIYLTWKLGCQVRYREKAYPEARSMKLQPGILPLPAQRFWSWYGMVIVRVTAKHSLQFHPKRGRAAAGWGSGAGGGAAHGGGRAGHWAAARQDEGADGLRGVARRWGGMKRWNKEIHDLAEVPVVVESRRYNKIPGFVTTTGICASGGSPQGQ